MGELLRIPGNPDAQLSVTLFRDVQNSKELQERVVAGTLPADCSVINAVLIPDLFLLRVAAEIALQAQQRGKLKTRSLHAELVHNLSGSRHITESLRRFGISEQVSHVLIARFDATAEQMSAVGDAVKGTSAPVAELSSLADAPLIQKYHKIGEAELKMGSLVDAVACHMATRDAL
mmetsp:Transcript_19018/g.57475  ORF Transcript_19018/g.57475 Transcript_19018/m.57475 type:complete len:176 (+) Transcript_19018:122-649(+)